MPVDSSKWRKRRSSGKLQRTLLAALRGRPMTSSEAASEIRKRWKVVCLALDDLLICGKVERDGNRYRLMEEGQ